MQTGGSRPPHPHGCLAGGRLYTRSMPEDARPLPVLAEPRPIERPREASLPAAVVAATGGFLVGVATFLLVRLLRRPRRAASLRLGRGRGRGKRVEVATSRSFLVDIHLLKDR
jgi:hypothetical protein